MNLIPHDTTIDALQKQFEILERIGIAGRAEMTFQLSDNLRQIIEDGVRLRHPEYNDKQVRQEVLRITLGDELYRKAYGKRDRRK
jgi:pimeloyl-CoA synthetase